MANAKWEVTYQSPRPTFTPDGRPLDVMDIGFTVLDTGDTNIISIPRNQYTPERVREEIQDLADKMLAVRQLGNSG